MAYIEWWNRTKPTTLGERFGLNEISIARNTLSPTKSYTEGGRIGLQGGLLAGAKILPKVPEYIKTGQKIWNTGKRILNQLKHKDNSLIKSVINTAVNKDVGPAISVSNVNRNTGTITYRLQPTNEVTQYSTDIGKLMLERDTLVANKLKPFRDKGFISPKEMVKLFEERGISTSNITGARGITQQLSRIADTYKIEKIKVDAATAGSSFWYKIPSKEKLTEIWKNRLTPVDRIPIAKKLIKDLEIDSFIKLNKVMENKGYGLFKGEFMKKHFSEIKGLSFMDPKFVHFQKKFNARTVLNSIRYDLRKSMGSIPAEEFLISAKKSTGFGKLVHLMHTTTKQKKTGELLNVKDLNFGSSLENEAYGNGLDNIRSGLTTVLNNIANLHKGKNPNTIVDVNLTLQREYNFPKTMKLKDLINRVNTGLTDLALKTNGKVRGELLEFTGNKMKFVDNPIIDYESVLGRGLVEGTFKNLEPILKKFKVHRKTSEAGMKGDLVFDKNGMPVLKKNQELTQKEAETVLTIIENMKLQLPAAAKSKPFKGELKFAEGGRTGFDAGSKVWEGAKEVGKKAATRIGASWPWRAFERTISPAATMTLHGIHYAITGEKPDLTKAEELLIPAFWNSLMKKYKWTDKSSAPIKRRILNAIKRGGIPTSVMPLVSKIAAWAMIPAETYQAVKAPIEKEERIKKLAIDRGWDVEETLNMYRTSTTPEFNRAFFYKNLFGKTPDLSKIEETLKNPEYEKRKSYFTDKAIDQYWENKRTDPIKIRTSGDKDSYFMGGIASLIK